MPVALKEPCTMHALLILSHDETWPATIKPTINFTVLQEITGKARF